MPKICKCAYKSEANIKLPIELILPKQNHEMHMKLPEKMNLPTKYNFAYKSFSSEKLPNDQILPTKYSFAYKLSKHIKLPKKHEFAYNWNLA